VGGISLRVRALIVGIVAFNGKRQNPRAKEEMNFPWPFVNCITGLRLVQVVASGKRREIIDDLHNDAELPFMLDQVRSPQTHTRPFSPFTLLLSLGIKATRISSVQSQEPACSSSETESLTTLTEGSRYWTPSLTNEGPTRDARALRHSS